MRAPAVTMTVIKPFSWTNAIDTHGVTHLVVSLNGVMNQCGARCGLDGRWEHAKKVANTENLDVMRFTNEDVTCMSCLVWEARLAST